jgi:hypothetical protein
MWANSMQYIILFILSFINLNLFCKMQEKSKVENNKKDLLYIDGIRVVFRGPQGIDLITDSEVKRPKLDGSPNTLPDMIAQLAFGQEAKRYHMWPTPEEIDKQLRAVAQANKLSPEELNGLFLNYNYTPDEGRFAFSQMTAINNLISFKVTSNIFVPERDVINYYNTHPQYEDAAYFVQYAFVSYDKSLTKEEQLKYLKNIRKNSTNDIFEWCDPFWIQEEDISADKKFITQLKVNEISLPVNVAGGFGFYKLVSKKERRLRTLEERYREIVDILRRPKYSELMNKYQKELLEKASITEFED